MSTPRALSVSDDEYAAIQAAAAPVHPHERDAFLRSLAEELGRHTTIGPGLIHRVAGDLQRRFTVAARYEASLATTPRHLRTRAQKAIGGGP